MRRAILIGLVSLFCISAGKTKIEGLEEISKSKLKLQDCIKVALSNSDELKIEEQKEKAALEQINISLAQYWPRISLEIEALFEEDEASIDDSYVNSIKMVSNIFDAGIRSFNVKEARANHLVQQGKYTLTYEDVIYRIASAYIKRISLENVYLLSKKALEGEKKHLSIAQVRSKEGLVPKLDVTKVEAEIRQAKISLAQDFSKLKRGKSSLNYIMGIDLGSFIEIEKINWIWWNNLMDKYGNIEDCLKKAWEERVDYKVALYKLMAKQAALKAAKAGTWPKISLEGNYYIPLEDKDLDSNFDVNFTFNLPLFDAGLTKAHIKKAKVEVEAAQSELVRLKKQIYKEVEDAYQDLKDLQGILIFYEERLYFLSKNLEAERNLYNTGMTDIQQLTDTYQNYVRCKSEFTQTKYKILLDLLELLQRIGGIKYLM